MRTPTPRILPHTPDRCRAASCLAPPCPPRAGGRGPCGALDDVGRSPMIRSDRLQQPAAAQFMDFLQQRVDRSPYRQPARNACRGRAARPMESGGNQLLPPTTRGVQHWRRRRSALRRRDSVYRSTTLPLPSSPHCVTNDHYVCHGTTDLLRSREGPKRLPPHSCQATTRKARKNDSAPPTKGVDPRAPHLGYPWPELQAPTNARKPRPPHEGARVVAVQKNRPI